MLTDTERQTISAAIEESRAYNTPVTLTVSCLDDITSEIYALADGDDVGHTEDGDALDVWGYDPEADETLQKMTFRLHITEGK